MTFAGELFVGPTASANMTVMTMFLLKTGIRRGLGRLSGSLTVFAISNDISLTIAFQAPEAHTVHALFRNNPGSLAKGAFLLFSGFLLLGWHGAIPLIPFSYRNTEAFW